MLITCFQLLGQRIATTVFLAFNSCTNIAVQQRMRVQQHTNDQFLRSPTPMNQNEVSLATRTLGESSFPFLELPREIRDQIYGYLLSNKYTKCIDEGRRDYYNTDNHIMHVSWLSTSFCVIVDRTC